MNVNITYHPSTNFNFSAQRLKIESADGQRCPTNNKPYSAQSKMSVPKKTAMKAAAELPACFICMEPFTKQPNRKPVSCPHCPSDGAEPACVRCIQYYISTSIEDPHCPTCRKAWTYEYICENFPKTWYNGEFKKRREAILMDRERSRLPEAQGWAERMRKAKYEHKPALIEVKRRECELKNRSLAINCERDTFLNNYRFKVDSEGPQTTGTYRVTLDEFQKRLTTVHLELNKETDEKYRLDRLYENMMNMSDQQLREHEDYQRIRAQVRAQVRAENQRIDRATEEALIQSMIATIDYKKGAARVFTMKCPGEECRGFLSTAYKCGICERSTCAQCLIQYPIDDPKGEAHECTEDDKKTVEFIKKSCRNCPCCGMSIYRIEGCNQMFCTACNTAFDWVTGTQLNTRQIHNPHYTDYLRQTGGAAQGTALAQAPTYNPCGGAMIEFRQFVSLYDTPIMDVIKWAFYTPKGTDVALKKEYIYGVEHAAEVVRLVTHLSAVEIPDHRRKLTELASNQKLNAEYLVGIHTQDAWKKKIMGNEVQRLAYNEAVQSIQAFNAVCTDVYANFAHHYNETLKTLPVKIRPVFSGERTHNSAATLRKWTENNDTPAVLDILATFMEHYKKLLTETKALIAIMNAKMESIIKTYKVKINCYNEHESVYNRVNYRATLISYTELHRVTRGEMVPIQSASRIARRPATGGLAAPEPESSDYDTEEE